MSRFDFEKRVPRQTIAINMPEEMTRLIVQIAEDNQASISSIARAFVEVGMEEFLKENPKYKAEA